MRTDDNGHDHSHSIRGTKMNLKAGSKVVIVTTLAACFLISLMSMVFMTMEYDQPRQAQSHRHNSAVLYGQIQECVPLNCSEAVIVALEDGSQHLVNTNGLVKQGDRIRLGGDYDGLYIVDVDRSLPALIWVGMFIAATGLVAGLVGLKSIASMGVTFGFIVGLVCPIILNGGSPIPAVSMGIVLALYVSVYFTHGVSWMTSAALLGTICSIALTVLLSWVAVKSLAPLSITEEMSSLFMVLGDGAAISLEGLLLAGFIVGTIGALNDVIISQASTAWELRDLGKKAAFLKAMKVGRDHVASSVYTIAFAYAGTAMPLILMLVALDSSLRDSLTTGAIVVEIVRAAVGGVVIALSTPLVTALVVLLIPDDNQQGISDGSDNECSPNQDESASAR